MRSWTLFALVFPSVDCQRGKNRQAAEAGGGRFKPAAAVFSLPLIPHHKILSRRSRRLGQDGLEEISALYQGYGTHYVDLWVGTPPQRQTAIVDTGSGITAFPCSLCSNCGYDHHTDSAFVETNSSTFRPVACDKCSLGPCGSLGHGGLDDICIINMRYEEGSSWKAYESWDLAYVGGPHNEGLSGHDPTIEEDANFEVEVAAKINGSDPFNADSFRFPLSFGCQSMISGLFKTQLADGIVGMEWNESAIWSQMYVNGVIQKQAFSLCYLEQPSATRNGNGSGALTLGGYDQRLHDTPLVWAENVRDQRGFYVVEVRQVYLRANGGESAAIQEGERVINTKMDQRVLNDGHIIVDSGTTNTYLKKKVRPQFAAAWKEATGQELPPPEATIALFSPDQLKTLPTILFQLRVADVIDPGDAQAIDDEHIPGLAASIDPANPRDVLVALPAGHYLTPIDTEGNYEFRIHFTEANLGGGVIGANILVGHDVAFDLDNNRLGFAESRCDYEGINGGGADPA